MASSSKLVLGIMSGSSLDGVDLALCRFSYEDGRLVAPLDWEIVAAKTIPFPGAWRARLRQATVLPGRELWRLHTDFGHYLGKAAAGFLHKNNLSASLIGSHGHTIFHDPQKGSTTQIGEGSAISYHTGVSVVTQLRTADMALGGQGAPAAPIADHYLFPDYEAFLNLGGIANISVRTKSSFLAGDVSAANQILDRLAGLVSSSYRFDQDGHIAASGSLSADLLLQLQALPHHQMPYPKSLDNRWVSDTVWPLLAESPASVKDRLHTFCIFLTQQIHGDLLKLLQASERPPSPIKVLVSGGGARNDFLIKSLRSLPQDDHFPLGYATDSNTKIGDFKEAAMVALMALLRQLGQPNSFASATGARADAINGAMYLPPPISTE